MDDRSPFTAEEILVLRGMIDEYLYHERRAKFWRGTWGAVTKFVALVGALAVIASAMKTLVAG